MDSTMEENASSSGAVKKIKAVNLDETTGSLLQKTGLVANKRHHMKYSHKLNAMFEGMTKLSTFLMTDLQEVNYFEIDSIKIWKHLSAICGHLISMKALPLTKLKEHFEKASFIENGQGSIFLKDIFLSIQRENNMKFLENLWLESGLHLEDFMSATEVPNFIKANKFEFLKKKKKQSVSLPFVGVDKKLLEMFSLNVSTEKIIEWIRINVGPENVGDAEFIRILATAIFYYCCSDDGELSASKLSEKYVLLTTYTDDKIENELQCLYALQKFVNQLGNPKGLMLKFFEQFYGDSIISVASFLAWESSRDCFETEGKELSLKELEDFFITIKETDSDQECSSNEKEISHSETETEEEEDVLGLSEDENLYDRTFMFQDPENALFPDYILDDEPDKALINNDDKLVQTKNESNKSVFHYVEDQWTPYNQSGKKKYERDFLLALREFPISKKRPEIPILDVISADNKKTGPKQGLPSGKIANKLESSKSVDDVKLNETENPWRPSRFSKGVNLSEDDKKTEEIYKKVRGVLNKLTPQKFETLVQQVRQLQIDTEERLQGLVDCVFKNATANSRPDEPNFSVAYAYMCKELRYMAVPTATSTEERPENVNFRKLLITRCQVEFEKQSVDESVRNEKLKEIEECADPEKKKELQFDLEEYDRRLRMKSVGNIRFIGELFKQEMLSVIIMIRCLNNLLENKDEESLECLCKLLTTIGKEMETKGVNLGNIFNIMKEIVDKKHGRVSSRVRFMLQDVIDLRRNKWVPRRQELNPKTIDQIQKEAENEQLNIQAMNSVPIQSRKDDRGTPGPSTDRKRGGRNVSDDGWQTQSRQHKQFTVQSDELKSKIPVTDEPSLGSRTRFGDWSEGSTFKNDYGATTTNTANMYAAVENIDQEKRSICEQGGALSYEHIHSKLIEFFKSKHSLDEIVTWITANVGDCVNDKKFIRTLATAIFEYSVVNNKLLPENLKDKYNLLLKYVDNKPEYELQCLYALQTFSHKLEHPQGLLLSLCERLYEDSLFSQDSFIAWETSTDPAEQEGKGVAIKQLTSFFTQLKENEEDDEEESEEDT